MDKTLGFIGTGNMGNAMIRGVLNAGLFKPKQIIASDLDTEKLELMSVSYGIETASASADAAERADIIVLAVKPDIYGVVLEDIKSKLTPDKIIVTIAAGITLQYTQGILGSRAKVIRAMPNTPALAGAGMSALCPNKNVSPEELRQVKSIFEAFGRAETLPENLFDAVTGISGSSPAFVFMFIEAMADAGVLAGMPRSTSYRFAAQAVFGAAKMLLETEMHPGVLKDMVCSPGGTTIEGVTTLENRGFRASVIEGVMSAVDKSVKMSGNKE